jgi:signal transduction histidine kinase
VADEFALRLDTAVLFDEVRRLATAEERKRIAREMHDGVAQELVALGYIVDEIASVSNEAGTRALADSMREEITRVVAEIRYSILDLRHHVAEHRLSGALADYVHQVTQDMDLRVNLVLDESGPSLPPRTESELLRVAQEAIGNVRKHAHADNLWVTLVSDGSTLLLEVEDDGVGNAMPKERHWGLESMQERAAGIDASLEITPRDGGGTVVRLQSPPQITATKEFA